MDLSRTVKNIKDAYNKAGQEYFNLFHDELNQHEFDKQLLINFIENLSSDPIVCDIGCGPAAQYGRFISDSCKKTYAVDISEENIKIAKKHNPQIIFKCENMLHTSFDNSFFDGLISFYAIFHIPKKYNNKFFKEAYRILKPGGKLLLMTHKGDLVKTVTSLWKRDDLELFINFHKEDEIIKSARLENFKIVSCYSKTSYYDFPEERIILIAQKPKIVLNI